MHVHHAAMQSQGATTSRISSRPLLLVFALFLTMLTGCSLSATTASSEIAQPVTPTAVPTSSFDGGWYGKGSMHGTAGVDAWYIAFHTVTATQISATAQECHQTGTGSPLTTGYVAIDNGTLQQSDAFQNLSLQDSSGYSTVIINGKLQDTTLAISGTFKTNDGSNAISVTLASGYINNFQSLCASLPAK